ncbi:MAG: tRNA (adenosine(37)-N6)-dimethylallyltransferase MiaA [Pyrinomonadaceae bacterium]|nr:tRNA (adenosine(37)-N6)-dimethylallyltransferase MiaA [Pyrinomonadaceae bacterium]
MAKLSVEKWKMIIAIAGPTASGKSELGIELALKIDGEIINCDSVQVYRDIEVATAKVPFDERRGVSHHLLDFVAPSVNFTVADWTRLAFQKIEEIESRGKTVIFVGGTGFYLRSLTQPLFESPATDENLRGRLNELRTKHGAEFLHKMLQRLDKTSADRYFPRDYQKVQRALEFRFQTGKPFSSQQIKAEASEIAARLKVIVLNPPRDVLYEKINARAEFHFANGLIEETKSLREGGLSDDSAALRSHGYARAVEFLRGERSLESAIDLTKQNVRNYAKRQLTWFRREKDVIWLDGFGDDKSVQAKLFEIVGCYEK